MVKKNVPDWLNSSLWSSSSHSVQPPAPADRTTHPLPKPHLDPPRSDVVTCPPVPEPPPPPPPLPPAPVVGPRKPERRDPLPDEPSAPRFSHEEASRQSQLLSELSKKIIGVGELRRLTAQGIPDGGGIRATVWKSEVTRRLDEVSGVREDWRESRDEGSGLLTRSHVIHGEHPLSLGHTSVWNQYFQDSEIIEQIDRDVKRTHPDMNFFCGESSSAKSNQEALKRILIIFAKLNPGIRYVQGMNEILAPIYYVFGSDPDEHNVAAAEADTFFCFVEILSGFRDNFCQQLDNSIVGIRSTITRLSQLLKKHDEELWRHLEVTTKVNPQFYAFRWITLLLTQEFIFADCLLIWDTLLSDPEGPPETLLRICCAMLILIRRRLLAGDFTSNLKLLQSYPSTNISHLLYVANKLRGRPAS